MKPISLIAIFVTIGSLAASPSFAAQKEPGYAFKLQIIQQGIVEKKGDTRKLKKCPKGKFSGNPATNCGHV